MPIHHSTHRLENAPCFIVSLLKHTKLRSVDMLSKQKNSAFLSCTINKVALLTNLRLSDVKLEVAIESFVVEVVEVVEVVFVVENCAEEIESYY